MTQSRNNKPNFRFVKIFSRRTAYERERRIGFGSPRDAAAPFYPCEAADALMKPISSFLTTRCTSAPRGYESASIKCQRQMARHVLASLHDPPPVSGWHREASVCTGVTVTLTYKNKRTVASIDRNGRFNCTEKAAPLAAPLKNARPRRRHHV